MFKAFPRPSPAIRVQQLWDGGQASEYLTAQEVPTTREGWGNGTMGTPHDNPTRRQEFVPHISDVDADSQSGPTLRELS